MLQPDISGSAQGAWNVTGELGTGFFLAGKAQQLGSRMLGGGALGPLISAPDTVLSLWQVAPHPTRVSPLPCNAASSTRTLSTRPAPCSAPWRCQRAGGPLSGGDQGQLDKLKRRLSPESRREDWEARQEDRRGRNSRLSTQFAQRRSREEYYGQNQREEKMASPPFGGRPRAEDDASLVDFIKVGAGSRGGQARMARPSTPPPPHAATFPPGCRVVGRRPVRDTARQASRTVPRHGASWQLAAGIGGILA